MKKVLSFLLAVMMLATVLMLAACGEAPADTTGSSALPGTTVSKDPASSASTSATTVSGSTGTAKTADTADTSTTGSSGTVKDDSGYAELDGLTKHPDYMDVNFGGKTFCFISQKGWSGGWDCYEICAEITGNDDIIDEAIDRRNKTIENLYNCKITQDFANENMDAYKFINEDATLGRCRYQFCMQMYSYLYMNNFYNYYNLDVDLTHPWWNSNFTESLTEVVDGKNHLYTVTGPFNLITYDSAYGILVNKELYDQLSATGKIKVDCFQAVHDGSWTFDLFTEVASAATADTNGDQKMTYEGGDIFGCTDDGNYYGMRSLFYGSGVKSIVRDDNGGFRSVQADDSEFGVINDIVDKLIAFYASGDMTVLGEKDTVKCIADGQSLFNPQYLYRLHNKDEYVVYGVDYGDRKISILPFPKYTETQEHYYTFVCNRAYGLKVARTISDPADISAFVELFGFHSAKILYPAYVQCLKTQCLCDEEAGEMLEIIMNNLIFDYGTYLSSGVGFVAGKMANMVTTKKNNFSRAISQLVSTTAIEIESHITELKKLGQS